LGILRDTLSVRFQKPSV